MTDTTWTVVGVWDGDEPISVGVIAGEHEVAGGDEFHFDGGLWATSVQAGDPSDAESAAIREMATSRFDEDEPDHDHDEDEVTDDGVNDHLHGAHSWTVSLSSDEAREVHESLHDAA